MDSRWHITFPRRVKKGCKLAEYWMINTCPGDGMGCASPSALPPWQWKIKELLTNDAQRSALAKEPSSWDWRHHFLHDPNCAGCIKLLSKGQNHTLLNMNNVIAKDQHYFLQKEDLVVLILWVSCAKSKVAWSLAVLVLRSKPRSAQRMALPSPAARFQISQSCTQLYSSELQASRTDAKATRRTAPW